jgi:hypothetical protein
MIDLKQRNSAIVKYKMLVANTALLMGGMNREKGPNQQDWNNAVIALGQRQHDLLSAGLCPMHYRDDVIEVPGLGEKEYDDLGDDKDYRQRAGKKSASMLRKFDALNHDQQLYVFAQMAERLKRQPVVTHSVVLIEDGE